MNENWVAEFRKGLEGQAAVNEARRQELTEVLKTLTPLHISVEEFPIYYFAILHRVVGYRRISNGFELFPCFSLELALLRTLIDALEAKK